MTKRGIVALPNLEKWRAYKLMTRIKLAAEAGVSLAIILKIENGAVAGSRYGTVVKLAQGLGISTDDLLYRTPPAIQASFSETTSA